MTRCSYVIAYRGGDRDEHGARAANLAAVVRHVGRLPDAQIVVVEQDTVPRWEQPADVTHVFLRHDGPFNKSWAMNVGFRHTVAPIVAFGDADLILPLPDTVAAIDSVANGYDAVDPFDRLVELTEPETVAVWSGGALPEVTPAPGSNRRGGEYVPFCGGLFVIDRTAFARVGGYDERFAGWGGEDDALSVKLARMGLRCGVAETRGGLSPVARSASRPVHAS